MKKPLGLSLLFFFLSIIQPVSALSEKIVIDSEDQFRFATQYMGRGEYDRAIGEFERFIYFFPKNDRVPEARYHIGECFLRGRRYEAARRALEEVCRDYPQTNMAGKALFLIGESYYMQGVLSEAEFYYRKVIEEYPQPELKSSALYRLGWNRMKGDRWREAAEIFKKVEKDSPLYGNSLELAERSIEGEHLAYKDPTTAGVMAGILPGLGHAYCNRYKDGLVALLLNGSFVWAAVESFEQDHDVLGGILLFLELGWYSGNIYSAVNSAHKHNRKIREDFLKGLPDDLRLNIFSTREGHIGLALRFDF
ncbi:MAG: tetratricopeptide repeat protein [Pseudomonadota bacterium]